MKKYRIITENTIQKSVSASVVLVMNDCTEEGFVFLPQVPLNYTVKKQICKTDMIKSQHHVCVLNKCKNKDKTRKKKKHARPADQVVKSFYPW